MMTDRTSPETETLLPCPFCGGRANIYTNEVDFVTKWSVGCGDCNCNMDVCEDTPADAAVEWNTRGLAPTPDLWRPIETAPKDGTWLLVWEQGINTKYHPSEIARFINNRWENSASKFVNAVAWQPAPIGPASPDTSTVQPPTIDDVPSCGQENDYTRAQSSPIREGK